MQNNSPPQNIVPEWSMMKVNKGYKVQYGI